MAPLLTLSDIPSIPKFSSPYTFGSLSNFYINVIIWKTENCQIGVNAQAPGAGGGACHCPIADDANECISVCAYPVRYICMFLQCLASGP